MHEVAAAAGRVDLVAGNCRQLDAAPRAAGRPGRTGPCRPVKSVGPKPMVRVSCGRRAARAPHRCPSAGRTGSPPTAPAGRGLGPGGHPLGRRGPAASASRSSSRLVGRDVEGDEVHPVLGRASTMPAWCWPRNGDRGQPRRSGSTAAGRPRRHRTGARRCRHCGDQPATRRGRLRRLADEHPRSARRGCCILSAALLRGDRRDLADRLASSASIGARAPDARAAVSSVVQHEPVTVAVLFEQLPRRPRSARRPRRPRIGVLGSRGTGAGPGPRPASPRGWRRSPTGRCGCSVLLAGDLAGGDLVEQGLGPVGELESTVKSVGLRRADELLDVGEQLVGDRRGVGLQAGHPQVLLEAVEAGELHAVGRSPPRARRSAGRGRRTTRRPARSAPSTTRAVG